MILLLAALSSVGSIAGCQSLGASVHCELAPPQAPAVPLVPRAETPVSSAASAKAGASRGPLPRRTVREAGVVPAGALPIARPAPVPTDANIRRHVATLVAISDCTGARVYARSVGASELAEAVFASCIGLPPSSRLLATTSPQTGAFAEATAVRAQATASVP
jgi:hypothetical protein